MQAHKLHLRKVYGHWGAWRSRAPSGNVPVSIGSSPASAYSNAAKYLGIGQRIHVSTRSNASGDIVQEVHSDSGELRARLSYEVIRTKEAQVRAALIKLGWKPPEDTNG